MKDKSSDSAHATCIVLRSRGNSLGNNTAALPRAPNGDVMTAHDLRTNSRRRSLYACAVRSIFHLEHCAVPLPRDLLDFSTLIWRSDQSVPRDFDEIVVR